MSKEKEPQKGSISLLAGPPGAGKTTVAAELVRISPAPLICIEGDLFWSFIKKKGAEEPKFLVFRLVMRSLVAAATPFVRSGYHVLLDFSFPPLFVEKYLMEKRGTHREYPVNYIILLPSEKLCASRAANREEGKIEDYGNFQEFYNSFTTKPEHTISDDELDPESLAKQIYDGIQKGKFRIAED